MRSSDIGRPLTMLPNLWCRVKVVVGSGTVLLSHELGGSGLPDLGAVDEVAGLALLAGRLGGRIILTDVSPAMRSLLELAGLRVEVEREAKGGEEPCGVEEVQEELHPGDLAS